MFVVRDNFELRQGPGGRCLVSISLFGELCAGSGHLLLYLVMSDHTEHVTICFFRFVVIDANFCDQCSISPGADDNNPYCAHAITITSYFTSSMTCVRGVGIGALW